MNDFLTRGLTGVLLLILLGLGGCAAKGGAGEAAAAPAAAGLNTPMQGKNSGRLLVWTASFTLEVADLNKGQAQLSERLLALGGYIEEKTDNGSWSQSVVYRVPKERFETALGTVEQSGKVLSRHVKGEDVTEHYVDVETRLNNNIALRDRLKALLGKAVDVKDIISIETELNRIQSEIDSMDARMRVLKDQIQMSTIRVDLRQQAEPKRATIYGPLGYLYKGTAWFVTKLFIIRE